MHPVTSPKARRLAARLGAIAALGLAAVPFTAGAQVATTSGYLSNFDVVNHTGQDACGFEVELHGIRSSDVFSDYSWQRFGSAVAGQGNPAGVTNPAGSITTTALGTVVVRYASTVREDGSCSTKTVPRPNGNFVGTCYMNQDANLNFTPSYESSGCEHFGIHTSVGPTKTTYHWLVVDPVTRQLVPHADNLPIAAPVYYWNPPAAANGDPVLVMEIEAADPPDAVEQYGDAQWVRITKTKLPRDAVLTELRTDDPIIQGAEVEIDWELLQQDPPSGGNQRRRGKGANSDAVNGGTTRAIIRRYETYAYSGTYDPITHEATCVNLDVLTGNCTAPADGELGDYIGANMVAANVDVNGVWVSRAGAGAGTISSTDRVIDCGNKCAATYDLGTLVSLTVKPDSKSAFAGWGGACTGTGGCTVTAGEGVNVTANFTSTRTATGGGGGGGGTGGTTAGVRLSVALSGKGLVTSRPSAINCGNVCSATVTRGASYTLTATPEAGNAFGGWTGACAAAGTSTTCEVMVGTQAINVGATFTRIR